MRGIVFARAFFENGYRFRSEIGKHLDTPAPSQEIERKWFPEGTYTPVQTLFPICHCGAGNGESVGFFRNSLRVEVLCEISSSGEAFATIPMPATRTSLTPRAAVPLGCELRTGKGAQAPSSGRLHARGR